MFQRMGVPQEAYEEKLSNHFGRIKEVARERTKLDINNLFLLADTLRLHGLIEQWFKVEQERSKIYQPKDEFLRIINSLFLNKSASVDERNRLRFWSHSGDFEQRSRRNEVKPRDLSSGEKQILVIMGETLLQEGSRHVFLADEPELSLHIEWQAALVENIRSLNQNCQVMFATHSPDVVGKYDNHVINFEFL